MFTEIFAIIVMVSADIKSRYLPQTSQMFSAWTPWSIVYLFVQGLYNEGARGSAVVEALRYIPEGIGSISDGVTGFFH
jgi:hypothetical protein